MKSVPLLVQDDFEGQAVDICLFREKNINIFVDIWYVWYVFLPEKNWYVWICPFRKTSLAPGLSAEQMAQFER